MNQSFKYAATGAGLIALTILALWPFLDAQGHRGVLIAAAIALPVQVGAFALLLRYRGEVTGFLAVWAGGTLFRLGVVAVVAIWAVKSGGSAGISMLLALAGFFFGLLLLEPVYLGLTQSKQPEVR